MEFLADRIADYFIRNGAAEEENRDIYVYGLIHVFSHSIGLAVAMVVGFSFSIPFEVLVFFIPLTMVRISAGGYHAGTFWRCIAVSVLTILAVATAAVAAPCIVFFYR